MTPSSTRATPRGARTTRATRPPASRRAAPASGSAATMAFAAFAAAMTRRDAVGAAHALRRAKTAGASRRAAEEAALMLMLYAGYPCALEGLRVLGETWPGRARRTREAGPGVWLPRGRALCRRVYGAAYPKLIPAVEALHPDLARWMEEQGYGRVLSRPGMGAADRELVTIAALAALGWERQLLSHLLGAKRLGASSARIERALRIGLTGAGAAAWRSGVRAWEAASGPVPPDSGLRAGRKSA